MFLQASYFGHSIFRIFFLENLSTINLLFWEYSQISHLVNDEVAQIKFSSIFKTNTYENNNNTDVYLLEFVTVYSVYSSQQQGESFLQYYTMQYPPVLQDTLCSTQ